MTRPRVQPRPGRAVAVLYLLLVYGFLLGPMAIVFVAAFNSAAAFPSPFQSFSLHWFDQLFARPEFMRSLTISLEVGLAAAGLATLLGLPLSLLLVRGRFAGKGALDSFFQTPLIIPQVSLSIALLQMFSLLAIPLGVVPLVLAHVVFILPYVLRAVMASLRFVSPSVEEAAMNLGANRLQTFALITVPMIRAGITAGFVLAFIMSFINVPLSLFLSTPAQATLPIRVLAYMESRLNPVLAAVAALTIVTVACVSLFLERVLKMRLIF